VTHGPVEAGPLLQRSLTPTRGAVQVALAQVLLKAPSTSALPLPLAAMGVHVFLGNWWNVIFFGKRALKEVSLEEASSGCGSQCGGLPLQHLLTAEFALDVHLLGERGCHGCRLLHREPPRRGAHAAHTGGMAGHKSLVQSSYSCFGRSKASRARAWVPLMLA
jgi:hypothetical protein